jgi:nucleotide-binding universal stress UspA family protein
LIVVPACTPPNYFIPKILLPEHPVEPIAVEFGVPRPNSFVTAKNCVTHCHCQIKGQTAMFKKILVPTDGSELADFAILGAIDYAQHAQASLVGMTVVDRLSPVAAGDAPLDVALELNTEAAQEAQEFVERIAQAARHAGVECETLVVPGSTPWSAIVETAENCGCDAIFMASHGRSGIEAVLLGSVTSQVLSHAAVPVLVYR